MSEITISILIINDKYKNNVTFLTVENNKNDFDILIPSGTMYTDEIYLNAAVRIVKKETGLTAETSDLNFLSIDNHDGHLNFTYILRKWSDHINKKVKWINIDELKFSKTYSNLFQKYNSLIENESKAITLYSIPFPFNFPSCNLL